MPRNAQALARHSTIDLTMNVYTHVAMDDLASDIESLPAVTGAGCGEPAAATSAAKGIPQELASLASSWDSLPDHVRQTIAILAGT